MTEHGAGRVLPTVKGFGARQAIATLRGHNVGIAPLLKRAGLSANVLHDVDHRMPAASQSKLLEYAAEATNDSVFGLHLAEKTSPREAGLLFYVASAAKNLQEALVLFERYFRIVNEAVRLELIRHREAVAIEFNFFGLPRHSAQQNTEFGMAVMLQALREVAGRKIRPTRVAFAHERNSHLREFERFYGCPVEFASRSDQLEFSKETLTLPLVTEDRHLLDTLKPFCEQAAKERKTAPRSLRAEVENELQKSLPHGKAQKQHIAETLGFSTRTLSRKLADEGTSYENVVDQVRRSLALQYIKEPNISLSQIAWLLGYEGATSFNHAFVRWTGRSPSAVRQKGQTPSPQ